MCLTAGCNPLKKWIPWVNSYKTDTPILCFWHTMLSFKLTHLDFQLIIRSYNFRHYVCKYWCILSKYWNAKSPLTSWWIIRDLRSSFIPISCHQQQKSYHLVNPSNWGSCTSHAQKNYALKFKPLGQSLLRIKNCLCCVN